MDYSEIVSISGMSGLFKVVSRRPDGMIVSPLAEEKPKFVSARIHMFTPLENITVYTEDDSVELKNVFQHMKKNEGDVSPVDVKADNTALKSYFEKIIPDYDREKVYVSDIKKIIKWYKELDQQDLINLDEEEEKDAMKTSGDAESTEHKKKEKASGEEE